MTRENIETWLIPLGLSVIAAGCFGFDWFSRFLIFGFSVAMIAIGFLSGMRFSKVWSGRISELMSAEREILAREEDAHDRTISLLHDYIVGDITPTEISKYLYDLEQERRQPAAADDNEEEEITT